MKKTYIIPNMDCAPLRAYGVLMSSPEGQEGGTGDTPGGTGDPGTPPGGAPRKPF